jgi:hypothetical protein
MIRGRGGRGRGRGGRGGFVLRPILLNVEKVPRPGCRFLSDDLCDWYHNSLEKIPDEVKHSGAPVASIFDGGKENDECDTCCHSDCKNSGKIRQKAGTDVKNCLCDSHYNICNRLTSSYKTHSDGNDVIKRELHNTDKIVKEYVELLQKSGLCIDSDVDSVCADALEYLDKIEPNYDNPAINKLRNEIAGRQQYITSCVDSDPEKLCMMSSTHKHWLDKLEALYSRALFMQQQIKKERLNVVRKRTDIRDKLFKTPRKSPKPKSPSPKPKSPSPKPKSLSPKPKSPTPRRKSPKRKSLKHKQHHNVRKR